MASPRRTLAPDTEGWPLNKGREHSDKIWPTQRLGECKRGVCERERERERGGAGGRGECVCVMENLCV